MNLTRVSELFKKYSWIFAFILAIFLLLVLISFRFSKQTEETGTLIEPQIEKINTRLPSYSFDKLRLDQEYPEQLPVYEFNKQGDLRTTANTYAQRLGITTDSKETNDIKLGSGLRFISENATLVVYKDTLSYHIFKGRTTELAAQINLDLLNNKSRNFFNSLNLNSPELNNYSTSFTHYFAEDSYEDKAQDGASLINLHYFSELSGLKLITKNFPTRASFDSSGELVSASYTIPIETTVGVEYSIIDLSTALTRLNNGEGSIIKIEDRGSVYFSVTNILDNVVLEEAIISYIEPINQEAEIQPFWVLKGSSVIDGQPLTVSTAIPAIEDRFFASK